jgi:hypothetical protein
MATKYTQEGDLIFISWGAYIPFAIRKSATPGHYLIGTCYLHGMMYGEVFDMEKGGEDQE